MGFIPYGLYPSLIKPFLFLANAETAHDLTINVARILSHEPLKTIFSQKVEFKPVDVMGLRFANPVGLAAGLDKNAEGVDFFGALGFGHIEVGTVTPKPQDGNPQPRMFRVYPANGIINRMGFNNKGVDYLVNNIKRRTYKGILGVSIGKNETTPLEGAVDDYLTCMRKVYPFTDYIAVNISCPNTPDLTSLQQEDYLYALLKPLKDEQAILADKFGNYVPLVVKLSPDLYSNELESLCKACMELHVDALSCTNTTVTRDIIHGMTHAGERGGLSGEPLLALSTKVLAKVNELVQGSMPLIGIGGVDGPIAAREKIAAGASLVQLYSSLVYKGPVVVKDIVDNL